MSYDGRGLWLEWSDSLRKKKSTDEFKVVKKSDTEYVYKEKKRKKVKMKIVFKTKDKKAHKKAKKKTKKTKDAELSRDDSFSLLPRPELLSPPITLTSAAITQEEAERNISATDFFNVYGPSGYDIDPYDYK